MTSDFPLPPAEPHTVAGSPPVESEQSFEGQWICDIHGEISCEIFAARLAEWMLADDIVTLTGEMGTGKTSFARALIRALAREPMLEVPSPTFTLMQIYHGERFPIVHADFYRIGGNDELVDLGWEEASEGALSIIEWAERIEASLPPDRLDIHFETDPNYGDDFRRLILTGHGSFAARLERARAIERVLQDSGWLEARREHVAGDASSRAYERLTRADGCTAILMVMPPRPVGPIIRFGKPYAAIARLALDIKPFLAMDQALRARRLSAPKIYAADIRTGTAVLEDLGQEGVVADNAPIFDRYKEAVWLLAALHSDDVPDSVPQIDDEPYAIPPYDLEAMLIEVEQILDWYAPYRAKITLSSSARAIFLNLWRKAILDLGQYLPTWTLRDFHSPNLIWQSDRSGAAQIGLIDFQDCVLGHPAYDVASLLQDARVSVPDSWELKLLSAYATRRRHFQPQFDMTDFAAAYAVMAAQRNTKILGIFTRLHKRDNKPDYLAHLPRVAQYLNKDLAHPALAEIKLWYETHLPQVFDKSGS